MREYWQTWCDEHTRRSAITLPESAPLQEIVCVGEAEPSDPQAEPGVVASQPAPNESDSTLVSSEISQSEIEKDEIADWIAP